jgi:hypothetical protein
VLGPLSTNQQIGNENRRKPKRKEKKEKEKR